MPVKVRCKHCDNVLTAPDKARGKAMKCPQCAELVRIPVASSKSRSRKRVSSKSSIHDDNFLAGMDLRQTEDTKARICKKCGTTSEHPDEIDCLNCHYNIDTGILSQRMKNIIARGGVDPDKFWGKAWGESWAFMMNIKKTVIRSSVNWSIFGTLAAGCFYASEVCVNLPPKAFWLSLCFLFSMAGIGWGLKLSILVVQATLRAKNTLDSPHFDLYAAIAWGVRALFWPILVFFPLIVLVLIFAGGDFGYFVYTGGKWDQYWNTILPKLQEIPVMPAIIVAIVLDLFVHLAWPIAVGHMAMPYPYKAYVPWEVFKLIAKNFLPMLYVAMFSLVPSLVIHLLVIFHTQLDDYEATVLEYVSKIDMWILGASQPEGFFYYVLLYPLALVAIYLHLFLLFLVVGFFAIYHMRIIGYLAYYFRGELEFVSESNRDELCGFSPRYVAALIDFLVMVVFCGAIQGVGSLIGYGWWRMDIGYLMYIFNVMGGLGWFILPWVYFARTQSSNIHQATLGKRAVGIVVYNEQKKTIDYGTASIRFFLKILSLLPLGAGCFMIFFNDKKQAMHDKMVKTLVVWKGDDTRR